MKKDILPYDPDLKTAILEIKEILDKYEIGASVALSSQTHSEYLNHFPKWCIVQFDKNQPGVRIRSKKEDFMTREEQHRVTEASAGLIANIRDINAQAFSIFDTIFKTLEKLMDIDHKPFDGHFPHFDN
jgi:hypothetical protein